MNATVKIMHRVYKYIFNQMRLLTIKSPTLEVILPEQVCIVGAAVTSQAGFVGLC